LDAGLGSFTLIVTAREAPYIPSAAIVSRKLNNGATAGYVIRAGTANGRQIAGQTTTTTGATTSTASPALADGLHAIALVRDVDAGTLNLYIDDVLAQSTALPAARDLTSPTRPFRIAAYADLNQPKMTGGIGAVIFERTARTIKEVAAVSDLYTKPAPAPPVQPYTLWNVQIGVAEANRIAGVSIANVAGLTAIAPADTESTRWWTGQDPLLWTSQTEGDTLASFLARSITPGMTIDSADIYALDPRTVGLANLAVELDLLASVQFRHLQPGNPWRAPELVQLPQYVDQISWRMTCEGQFVTTFSTARAINPDAGIVWDDKPTAEVWDAVPPETWR
jgi:hypothetical protein